MSYTMEPVRQGQGLLQMALYSAHNGIKLLYIHAYEVMPITPHGGYEHTVCLRYREVGRLHYNFVRMQPNHRSFVIIEDMAQELAAVYDSRQDIECRMSIWRALYIASRQKAISN